MCAVGAEAQQVLHGPEVEGLGSRFVTLVLQADAAELGVRPVGHQAEAAWIVATAVESGLVDQFRGGTADAAGEPVVAGADTPLREELIDRLRVPAALATIVAAVLVTADQITGLVAPVVLELQLQVALPAVAVRCPLPDEVEAIDIAVTVEGGRWMGLVSVIRIIGSIEANSVPAGQVAASARTSSSTICS